MKIWAKVDGMEGCKFLVVRRDGSVPHWPHFVLGARDPAAPAALRAYAKECQRLGFEGDYVASVRVLADDFEKYRAEQGNGDPEAPPHRKDNPRIIAAMRGEESYILARPDKGNVKK